MSDEILSPGTRVRVRRDADFPPGPWPNEPLGTVAGEPETVETTAGPASMYWVRFDEPQLAVDGEDRYESSQVLRKYLEVL